MTVTDQEKFDTFINHPAVAAYVGRKFDFYKEVWSRQFAKAGSLEKMRGDALRGGFFSLNLPALFFPVPWGFYRKTVKPALLAGLLLLAAACVSIVTGAQPPGLFYLAIILGIGSMANAYYFEHVWNFIESHKNLASEELERLAMAKGGTSAGYMIAGALLYGFLLSLVIGSIAGILG